MQQEDFIEQCFEEMWNEEARVLASSSLIGQLSSRSAFAITPTISSS